MLTRPFAKLVVPFGTRTVTQRRIVEEIVLGLLFVLPFGFWIGLFTIRLCAKYNPLKSIIRSDIWTTLVVFVIGDLLMEFLLPSLHCLPTHQDDYSWTWLLQSYGLSCPQRNNYYNDNYSNESSLLILFTPDATALLFTIRLLFLCLGVFLGESCCPIVMTGGIACGKTTVSKLFLNETIIIDKDSDNRNGNKNNNNNDNNGNRRQTINNNNNNDDDDDDNNNNDDDDNNNDKEGSFYMICSDLIAHEILLPPQVIKANPHASVHPNDSVYYDVVRAFDGEDIFVTKDDNKQQDQKHQGRANNETQSLLLQKDTTSCSTSPCIIDRRKLGTIVFSDRTKRRILNSITHPRVFLVLCKRMLYGIFWSSCDICCVDMPLLFESGKLRWIFGLVICVSCSPSLQLERLHARNPELSLQECKDRIASQMPLKQKEALADIVIYNNGDLSDLSNQVEQIRKDVMGRIYGIGMSLLQMLLLIGGSTSIAVSSKLYSKWQG